MILWFSILSLTCDLCFLLCCSSSLSFHLSDVLVICLKFLFKNLLNEGYFSLWLINWFSNSIVNSFFLLYNAFLQRSYIFWASWYSSIFFWYSSLFYCSFALENNQSVFSDHFLLFLMIYNLDISLCVPSLISLINDCAKSLIRVSLSIYSVYGFFINRF